MHLPRTPSGQRFTRRAAILAAVVAVLMLSLAYPIKQYIQQRSQIVRNSEDYTAQQRRIADLQEQKQRWADDDYVREQARARLQYVAPGELTYVITGDRPGQAKPIGKPDVQAQRPWYAQLWGGLQGSRRRSS